MSTAFSCHFHYQTLAAASWEPELFVSTSCVSVLEAEIIALDITLMELYLSVGQKTLAELKCCESA